MRSNILLLIAARYLYICFVVILSFGCGDKGKGGGGSVPEDPSGLGVTAAAEDRIDLTWQDKSSNEEGFRIERAMDRGGMPEAWEEIAQVGSDTDTYSDTGLSKGTTYWYRVCAFNSKGDSGYSNMDSAATLDLPAAPSGLNATAVSGTRIDLVWADNSNNELGFLIERSPEDNGEPDSWSLIFQAGADTGEYSDTDLTSGTVYRYRIRAYNFDGFSGYSNISSTVTLNPVASPANLRVFAASPSRIIVTWDDASDNEEGFRIERARDDNGMPGTWDLAGQAGTDVQEYSDSGLSFSTTYWYRAYAYNSEGFSGYSNEESVTTLDPPPAPSSLNASAVFVGRIGLAWQDNSSDEDGFNIARAPDNGGLPGTWSRIAQVGRDSTEYSDTGLAEGVTYWYRVWAYNAESYSGYSNEVSCTTLDPPNAPSGLHARVVSINRVDLVWEDNSIYELGFKIERAIDNHGVAGNWGLHAQTVQDITEYSGLISRGATLWYRICAFNDDGNSGYSNAVLVTIPYGRYLYAANQDFEWGFGSISAYLIQPVSGELSLIETEMSGLAHSSIAVHPSGKYAYTADFETATISIYSIYLLSGNLTFNRTLETIPYPACITIDPTGRFLYIIGGSSGFSIYAYSVSTYNGMLTLVQVANTESGSRFITVDPTGRFVYVANKFFSDVYVYSINGATGQLTWDYTYIDIDDPICVTISPDARFAYIPNYGRNTVSVYGIDPITGALAFVEAEAAGTPASVVIDRTGRFAMVANRASQSVSVYRIDPVTGGLTLAGSEKSWISPTCMTMDPTGMFVYAGTHETDEIAAFTLNTGTGDLTYLEVEPTGKDPMAVAACPVLHFAYAANADTVSVYAVKPLLGELSLVETKITGDGPGCVTVYPTGRFAYVVNQDSDSISAYTVSPLTGEMTLVETEPTGSGPVFAVLHPSGRFVYVANQGSDSISVYTIDPNTGEMGFVETESTGDSPCALAIHPRGSFIYGTNYGSSELSVFSIDHATGALTFIETENTGTGPCFIAVARNGKFAYVVNEGSDTIDTYAIDQASGELTWAASKAAQGAPRAIALSLSGNRAYTADSGSNTVSMFLVNPSTGELSFINAKNAGDTPVSVTVDPTGRFVYAGNAGSGTISVFSINQSSGELSPVETENAGQGVRSVVVY